MNLNSNCEAQKAPKKFKKILEAWVIWVQIFYFLKEKNTFKSYKIKSDHRDLR